MDERTAPALLAVVGGAVLVLLSLVPVVAVSYRRRGRFGPGDLLLLVAIPVYGLAILTYTLLPLPEVGPAFCAGRSTAETLQLRPFQFVADIGRIASGQDATGLRAWLSNAAVQQVVLNVVLFAPLGWLLRGPFRRSVPVAVVAGFAVSLLVELTQYTGNWFLFPCAYRLADVDDLIANTAGALLGALVAMLPGAGMRGGAADPDRPKPVTVVRRLLGVGCDLLAVWISGAVLGAALRAAVTMIGDRSPASWPSWFGAANDILGYWVPPVLALLVPLLGAGGTVGQRAVRLRPARPDGGVPSLGRRLLRALLGTAGFLLASGLGGVLGVLATVWGVVSLVGLFRTTGHTGVAGRVTGLTMVDTRVGPGERSPVGQGPTHGGG